MATPPGVTVNHLTRNYTKANRTAADIVWIVVHDMEMPEKPDTAEACRDYFQTTTREASAHYTIDNNSIVECVAVKDIAWAAPPNSVCIHLEHAGYAKQTSGEWLDPYGVAMLGRSAALTSWLCDTYRVPKRRLTIAEIQARKPGIVGHGDLTKAGVGGNTHTDPGPNFPWTYYLNLVNASTQQEDIVATIEDLKTALKDPEVLREIARFVWTGYVFGPEGEQKVAAGWTTQQDALVRIAIQAASDDLTPEQIAQAVRDAAEQTYDVKLQPKAVQ